MTYARMLLLLLLLMLSLMMMMMEFIFEIYRADNEGRKEKEGEGEGGVSANGFSLLAYTGKSRDCTRKGNLLSTSLAAFTHSSTSLSWLIFVSKCFTNDLKISVR